MRYFSSQKGFTLVEMVVSLGIFAVVAVVAVGALLKITDANKKSQSMKTAINNLNFALESMSREMRVGTDYHCNYPSAGIPSTLPDGSGGCESGIMGPESDWYVAFNSTKRDLAGDCNLIYAYLYDSASLTLRKAQQKECNDPLDVEDSFGELISPDVKIANAFIRVSSGGVQPKAFFWFKGHVGDRVRDTTEFELQTSVSQRIRY
jgi:prepilin-type N-terminal cleavage/methylation domain-containing protein